MNSPNSDAHAKVWRYDGTDTVTFFASDLMPGRHHVTVSANGVERAIRIAGIDGLSRALGFRPPAAGNVDSWTSWSRYGYRLVVRRHGDGSAEIAIAPDGADAEYAITGTGADVVAHIPEAAVTSLRAYLTGSARKDEEAA